MNEIEIAIDVLKNKNIVAAPTDTVYGLFADATSDQAVQEIYKVKGRPTCNPLIIHVSDIEMAKNIAKFSDIAEKIANFFWIQNKRPLTIVLPNITNTISKLATAGLSTIALRCPNHEISQMLIKRIGRPLAAPSANTSMSISPTSAEMVRQDLEEKVQVILDGGACQIGIESTILDLTGQPFTILRPGGVLQEEIESFLGEAVLSSPQAYAETKKAPGMMKKHYSPSIPLRINAAFPMPHEAFIAFGKTDVAYDLNLSITGDLKEAGQNLFQFLKKLDKPGKYTGIAMMPIPNTDIGLAINDRLIRAASS
jgi:L-threonylcarbamoyladenylate synthase